MTRQKVRFCLHLHTCVHLCWKDHMSDCNAPSFSLPAFQPFPLHKGTVYNESYPANCRWTNTDTCMTCIYRLSESQRLFYLEYTNQCSLTCTYHSVTLSGLSAWPCLLYVLNFHVFPVWLLSTDCLRTKLHLGAKRTYAARRDGCVHTCSTPELTLSTLYLLSNPNPKTHEVMWKRSVNGVKPVLPGQGNKMQLQVGKQDHPHPPSSQRSS